jgi:signal transduction histidine kinase
MSKIIIYSSFLTVSICGFAFSIGFGWWYGLLLLPLIIYLCYQLIEINRRILLEFQELVETVRYRDFTRRFISRKAPRHIRLMHNGFNEIFDTIIKINREKEMQYLYLQRIIEMVDTGILSYRLDTGEVLWINAALKNLLGIPALKDFNSLQSRNRQLFDELQLMGNERTKVISITKDYSRNKVFVAASIFIMQEIQYRLFAFQNVNESLDEAETHAWQRLLNVMTHEIMNSVSPVASLAGTLKNLVAKLKEQTENTDSIVEDIELGFDTIMRRSNGLLSFAETYRNLDKITELNISCIQAGAMFEHILQLMSPSLAQRNIELEVILKDPLMCINADVSLVEQILINLILNAVEAVKTVSAPHIILSAVTNTAQKPVIKVIDNGTGIADDIIDKIFIPFFSTRKNGNGIGLSICKQIMILHRGSIQVQTIVGEGTCFGLIFDS